jgi:hypothetical protein
MLQRTHGVYACALQHHYTAQQLDAALVERLRHTLQRTSRQVQQRQYLVALLAQRGVLVVSPTETAPLERAYHLTEQLLTLVTQPKQ